MTKKTRWNRGRFSYIFSVEDLKAFAFLSILLTSAFFFICSIFTLKAIPFLLLCWMVGILILQLSNFGKDGETFWMLSGAVYGVLTPPVFVSWAFRIRTDKRPLLKSGTSQSLKAEIEHYFGNIHFETIFTDALLLSLLIVTSVMNGIVAINVKRLRARRLKGNEYSKKSFRQKIREGYIKSDVNRPIK